MISCEPIESYKIPLKACQNSVIDHNLVTIRLSVEWPEKCGDNPNLVMYITNKIPPTTCMQQNQLLSPKCSNPVNHYHYYHHQRQDNFDPIYQQPQPPLQPQPQQQQQQQQYHYSQHHSPPINYLNLSNATIVPTSDQNDVSSTTTTEAYNSIQSQTLPSSTTIQSIGNQSQSQLIPNCRYQNTTNQRYSLHQPAMHAAPSNMNDSQLNMQMTNLNPISSMKQSSSLTTHADLQQTSTMSCPSSMLTNSNTKRIICVCSNPPNGHNHNCPVVNFNKQSSNTILTNETIYRPLNDQMIAHRTTFSSQIHSNETISTLSTIEPIQAPSLPFPNSDHMKTTGPSSNVAKIISKKSSLPPIQMPSLNTDNNFQQQTSNFSQIMMNNSSNYQTPSSISMPFEGQQNINSNNSLQQKQHPINKNSLINQDQLSHQNQNDLHQQSQSANNLNTSSTQPNNNHRILSCPSEKQQDIFIFPDNPQTITTVSADNTLHDSTNDINRNIEEENEQDVYSTQSNIRSPVKLDISTSQNLMKTRIGSPEIDQTISDVINGKGKISLNNKSISPSVKQQQKKQPLSAQLVWESTVPVTTKATQPPLNQEQQQQQQKLTYESNTLTLNRPNVLNITPSKTHSPSTGQSNINKLLQQKTGTDNSKKRDRSKSTSSIKSKRPSASNINMPHPTATSSSSQDMQRTTPTTPPITSQPNLVNTLISWSNASTTSSSPGRVTTTTTATTSIASNENLNHNLTNNSWQTLNIENNDALNDYYGSHDEQRQMPYTKNHHDIEIDDEFLAQAHEHFNSSTPPPPLQSASTGIISEILTPTSIDKSLSISAASVINADDVYENFFQSYTPSCLSISQENQVTSSVLTPPDFQSNHLQQQQYYSQVDEYFESQLQSQVRMLQSSC
ncbi:unnamed protein product [Rotaria sp. Silwood1]|nr:unnamed protein product [Rotaria sp. Silwood1]CAF3493552.1 unnamed protein product [Rotaria sp. Silwood1]CAF4766467.1 unnamed protein product [Rotaria sp. Silwood1]